MNRFLTYLKRLFIGGPEWLKYNGTPLFWPTTPPINSFPIAVYFTKSSVQDYDLALIEAVIDSTNFSLNAGRFHRVFMTPCQYMGDATRPLPRGSILIDTSHVNAKSNSVLHYATRNLDLFGERVGSIRSANIILSTQTPANLRWYSLQHELLHCLGLDHDTETGSVMNPTLVPADPYIITSRTLKALQGRYAR